jgi:hypothetical protein
MVKISCADKTIWLGLSLKVEAKREISSLDEHRMARQGRTGAGRSISAISISNNKANFYEGLMIEH